MVKFLSLDCLPAFARVSTWFQSAAVISLVRLFTRRFLALRELALRSNSAAVIAPPVPNWKKAGMMAFQVFRYSAAEGAALAAATALSRLALASSMIFSFDT